MTTLVTGGTGFLGRRLVERLLAVGRRVTVLARTPSAELEALGVRFISGAIEDEQSVKAACAGMQTVFHVAGKVGVWGRYDDFYRTNVLGTRTLIEAARAAGVRRFVFTSTPSVVYTGGDLSGVDESLPLTTNCPSPYPLTKALAEKEVLAANSPSFRTVSLRPHLIWGVGEPHLVPRVLSRARAGRLRVVGNGRNYVDMVHLDNAVDAHLQAETAVGREDSPAAGRAYFITNNEPVILWDWINELLKSVGIPPVRKSIPLSTALRLGRVCEIAWQLLRLKGDPPMTRFVATELASDHWFNIAAARRDLGYSPRVTMAAGMAELVAKLRGTGHGR